MINHFTDLIVWQKSRILFKDIYALMKDSKEYFLRDQILRATLPISNNIAEGFGRYSKKEYTQFLNISRGSVYEVESMLFILLDISSIDKNKLEELQKLISDIKNLLNALIQSVLRKIESEDISKRKSK